MLGVPNSAYILSMIALGWFLLTVWARPDEVKPFWGATFFLTMPLLITAALFLLFLPLILHNLRNP